MTQPDDCDHMQSHVTLSDNDCGMPRVQYIFRDTALALDSDAGCCSCAVECLQSRAVWDGEESTRVHKSPGAQIPVTPCIMAGDMCTRHEVWSIESTVWNREQSARVHKSPGAQIPVTPVLRRIFLGAHFLQYPNKRPV